jgi:hypothetical protein
VKYEYEEEEEEEDLKARRKWWCVLGSVERRRVWFLTFYLYDFCV